MLFRMSALSAGVVVACAGVAEGQFVSSITQPLFGENAAEVFFQDVNSGASQLLLDATDVPPATAPGFGGLAADEANRRLFGTVQNGGQTDLYSIDYDTLTPTLIGQTTLPGDTQSIAGLAYDTNRGVLYGTTLGLTGPEGLFTIDVTSGLMEQVLEFDAGGTFLETYNALDYDPLTDLVYLVDEDAEGGAAIRSFDPDDPGAGLSSVADLPSEFTDVDGLGAGDGRLYLLTDSAVDANAGEHGVYDIASGQFLEGIVSPFPAYTDSAVFGLINPSGAGAFAPGIPAPGAVVLLGLAGAGAARRRR